MADHQDLNKKPSARKVNAMIAPKFTLRFLLPQYWPIWIGAAFLYLITWLPYPLIKLLGRMVAVLVGLLARDRVAIARRNFELAYPDYTQEQRDALLKGNINRTGMALFETAMGWWWPTWRVKRISEVEGLENALKVLESGKGVLGLVIHNVNIEMCCRVLGLAHPCVGFYRKHNNLLLDYLQYHGRARSNKYLINRKNPKHLIRAINEGNIAMYFPDQDYGRKQSIFVPFGGVEKAATTKGTLMFAKLANCTPLFLTPQCTDKGYKVKISTPVDYLADNSPEDALTRLNEDLFRLINEQPEGYLWMHKRFKTRPEDEIEPRYKRKR